MINIFIASDDYGQTITKIYNLGQAYEAMPIVERDTTPEHLNGLMLEAYKATLSKEEIEFYNQYPAQRSSRETALKSENRRVNILNALYKALTYVNNTEEFGDRQVQVYVDSSVQSRISGGNVRTALANPDQDYYSDFELNCWDKFYDLYALMIKRVSIRKMSSCKGTKKVVYDENNKPVLDEKGKPVMEAFFETEIQWSRDQIHAYLSQMITKAFFERRNSETEEAMLARRAKRTGGMGRQGFSSRAGSMTSVAESQAI